MQYKYPTYSGFRCVACNIAFNSFDDQKQHYFIYHSRPINIGHDNIKEGPFIPRKVIKKTIIQREIRCDVCDVTCSSDVVYDFHIKGKKHKKGLEKLALASKGKATVNVKAPKTVGTVPNPQVLYTAEVVCHDCDIKCSTMEMLQKHTEGVKHNRTMKMKEYIRMVDIKDASVYCDICDIFLMKDLMIVHRNGGKHKRKCNDKAPNEPLGKKRKMSDGIITTVEHCGYCVLDLKSTSDAIDHYQSKDHAMNCSKAGSNFICDACMKSFNKQDMLDLHLKGFKHYAKVNRGNSNPEGEMAVKLLKMREKVKGLTKRQKSKTENESFASDLRVDNIETDTVENTLVETENKDLN